MKLLWVKTDFLHPTNRGGQIRTLELLKRLHKRHEVHYVGLANAAEPEGPERAHEYSTKAYSIAHHIPPKGSPAFWVQVFKTLASPLPLTAYRGTSQAMRKQIAELVSKESYDRIICDFVFPATSIDRIEDCVVYQHNVETMIWRRHAQHASDPLRRFYFRRQAARMERFERDVCRRASQVIAVSDADATVMATMFGIEKPPWTPTGVDIDYFRPTEAHETKWDLVFLGSMDWLPNIDGAEYFAGQILPIIRQTLPDASVALVGRRPMPAIEALGARERNFTVTGTVPDVRPYLWESRVSIVPLRIGGGTRLKIYESMAAERAVVSTSVGAEGLEIHPPNDIRIADDPASFAAACVELIENERARNEVAQAGATLVRENFSWDEVVKKFEQAAGLVS